MTRRLDTAAAWLAAALATGPLPAAKLKREAAAAGLAWRTLQRAAARHSVQQPRTGFPSATTWSLPPVAAPAAPVVHPDPSTMSAAEYHAYCRKLAERPLEPRS